MKLSTFALQNAVTELLPGTVVDLPSLGHPLEGVLDHDDMGGVLADLLFAGWPDASGATMPLRRVQMARPDAVLDLAPEDAMEHPLLRPWTYWSFGEALGKALWVGALRMDLEPGTPFIRGAAAVASLSTSDGGREYAGQFEYTINGSIKVALEYGAQVVPAPFAEIRNISGKAMVALGVRTREVTEQLKREVMKRQAQPAPQAA